MWINWVRELIPNWALGVFALCVLEVAFIGAYLVLRNHSNGSSGNPKVEIATTDLAPTVVNYQMVACQSLEKFDQFLDAQGNKRLPTAPLYTASSLGLVNP